MSVVKIALNLSRLKTYIVSLGSVDHTIPKLYSLGIFKIHDIMRRIRTMAKLLSCIVCGGKVSSDAYTCPHCGTKNFAPPTTKAIMLVGNWPEEVIRMWEHRNELHEDIHIVYGKQEHSDSVSDLIVSCEAPGKIIVPFNACSVHLHLDLVRFHHGGFAGMSNGYYSNGQPRTERLSTFDGDVSISENTQRIIIQIDEQTETHSYEDRAFRIGIIGVGKKQRSLSPCRRIELKVFHQNSTFL